MPYHHDGLHSHNHHHYSRDGIEQPLQWEQIVGRAKLKNEQHERGTSQKVFSRRYDVCYGELRSIA